MCIHTNKKQLHVLLLAPSSLLAGPVSSALPQWESTSSQVPVYSQCPSAVALQDQPGPSNSIPPDFSQGESYSSERIRWSEMLSLSY